MQLIINYRKTDVGSIEALAPFLDEMERLSPLEAWLSVDSGAALNLLRQGEHSFMMYLRCEGDTGFTTRGTGGEERVPFTLSNGQGDEYRLSWCVPLEECLRAFAWFCANDGARYPHVAWHEP